MFLLLFFFFLIKRYDSIFKLCNFLFNIDHNGQFSHLLKTYAIFLHWDRQLSWFYVFEQYTQILYTEIGNRPDDFMSFNELCNFYTDRQVSRRFMPLNELHHFHPADFFCIFWVNQHSMLSLEATNIWKSPKIDLRNNSMTAVICTTPYLIEVSPVLPLRQLQC